MENVSSSNSLGENVPKLRFPGFEGEWGKYQIGDFLVESKILGHNGKEAKKLTVKLWAKGIVEKTTIFDGSIQTQYYIRKSGQLMYGKLDFLNCAFGIVPLDLDGFESTSDAPAFDVLNINSRFLLNRIIQASFYKKNGEKANGSRKAKRIHPDTFLSMSIFVPSILEQEKIATFIALLEKKIELQNEIIDSLKLYKRGLLSKLFPQNGERIPQYRFKRFTDVWEQRKFEDIAVRSSSIRSESGLPRVEYEDIISGTGQLNKDIFSKESEKAGIVFHKGDVLYGKLRPYLQNWLFASFDGIAVGDFWVLQPQNTGSSFLYRLIQSRQFDEVANQSTGTKMPRADWKLVSQKVFAVPQSIDEQAAIGTYFEHLDHLIILHQEQCYSYKKIKLSLLQQMFI